MSHLNFSRANCKNCYKCLRSCPVKAIKFKNEQAEIIENRCINCGHCLVICPQNAREITSDLEKVKQAISNGKKVIASIAPSFAGYFNEDLGKFIAALKSIGFYLVEETAVAAETVTNLYVKYIKKSDKKIHITTCCPSVNLLVEKYYPELIPCIIPIVTPMTAHGKIIKNKYGEETFVVFIGPCIGKKFEADNLCNKYIDAVLTYEEVEKWIEKEKINFKQIKPEKLQGVASKRGRGYPINGGILNALGDVLGFEKLSVSGTKECIEVLNSIKNKDINGVIVEASACKGSCIGGPNRIENKKDYFLRLMTVKNYIKNREKFVLCTENYNNDIYHIDFFTKFNNKKIVTQKPLIDDINKIMKSMGKYSKEDELNCGVCGYDTCKDKAKAIYEGMAETTMCLHYMRSKAENISNVIFENTATSIIILNEDMNILELNPAAEEIFNVNLENVVEKPISILMNDEDFKYVKETGRSITAKKISIPQYNVIFVENIIYLPKQNIIMASMVNIMEEEKNKRELMKVKERTLDAAQEVIEKQMRVAQEIASLLGETTAETKMILTKLKKVVEGEEGEIR
ncbi:[Fe-Fe] hydrogenase large subunit C-terminal domain-containing protein [Clostridium rectalis]|uniref:[Fe-Fe] hydrogenase large subunit C-terminal domain-containing protein n=1 Tax=Clostridium rectalis TaxID=2040295 RepID=UPI000F637131|nr:[Fe-Fe] hydrogenase large subunit C-terminal domain-containing protein [Clostridium rectalis]